MCVSRSRRSRKWTVSAEKNSASQECEQDGHPEEEVDQVRQHVHDRQHLGREQDLLDQVPSPDQHAGGLGQRGLEPGPGQNPTEEEQVVRLHATGADSGKHVGEDEGVGQQQQQGVDEAPEEPEHTAAVAGLQLTAHQALNQEPVAEDRLDLPDHRAAAGVARAGPPGGLGGNPTPLRRAASAPRPGVSRPSGRRVAPPRSRSRP